MNEGESIGGEVLVQEVPPLVSISTLSPLTQDTTYSRGLVDVR